MPKTDVELHIQARSLHCCEIYSKCRVLTLRGSLNQTSGKTYKSRIGLFSLENMWKDLITAYDIIKDYIMLT